MKIIVTKCKKEVPLRRFDTFRMCFPNVPSVLCQISCVVEGNGKVGLKVTLLVDKDASSVRKRQLEWHNFNYKTKPKIDIIATVEKKCY